MCRPRGIRGAGALLVAGVLFASCGSGSPDTATGVATQPEGGQDIVSYMEDWSAALSDFETEYQAYFESLPAEPPGDVEFHRQVWIDVVDGMLTYTGDLQALETPDVVSSEHQAYVAAARDLFTDVKDVMASLTALQDFEGYHFEDFFSSPELTANHGDLVNRMRSACEALEQRLAEEGHQRDLACPPAK